MKRKRQKTSQLPANPPIVEPLSPEEEMELEKHVEDRINRDKAIDELANGIIELALERKCTVSMINEAACLVIEHIVKTNESIRFGDSMLSSAIRALKYLQKERDHLKKGVVRRVSH